MYKSNKVCGKRKSLKINNAVTYYLNNTFKTDRGLTSLAGDRVALNVKDECINQE